MATDHIEILRKQLLEKKREKEAELRDLEDLLRVLADAPKLLSQPMRVRGGSQQTHTGKQTSRYNLNLSRQVDDYIAAHAWDQGISINDMIKSLKRDQGVVGKDKSLYAYIHALLKKKTQEKVSNLNYAKGTGYYKSRKS